MASNIDISALTMNPLEVESIGNFVIEKTFTDPVLRAIHAVWTGVKMKEQIVLASQLGKTGITDSACARPNSGAESVLTQKYWEPANIGDTLVHCQTDVNGLFKAYYTKIQKYTDLFDITGSDLEKLLMVLLSESAMKTILRVAWLADTSVAVSGAAASGLKAAADVKYYDQIDGLWNQIFAAVTAGDVEHTTTKVAALNAQITTAAQTALATDDAITVFEDMLAKADSRLRAEPDAQFLVSRELFDNYKKTLRTAGENFTIDYTMEGFQSLKYEGYTVVNMENVWDRLLRADFEQDSTNNAYFLPNRAVFTTPANIPIATLNESDMSEIDAWYEKKERQMYSAYGYTLDAKLIEEYMIVVAY